MNKINDLLKYMKNIDSKKVKIIVAVGLIGIILISCSELFGTNKTTSNSNENKIDYEEYTTQLENRLEDVIGKIDGVGICKVMITLENTTESVYATDSEIQNANDSTNQKDEYVIYNSQNGETPVLVKEYMPRVQGVTIVCTGGDNNTVKENIIQSVTSLFNIPSSRVSVSKIKN